MKRAFRWAAVVVIAHVQGVTATRIETWSPWGGATWKHIA